MLEGVKGQTGLISLPIQFTGRLRTFLPGLHLEKGDFRVLQNLRYIDTGLRGVLGSQNLSISSVPNSDFRTISFFRKASWTESYLIIQGFGQNPAPSGLYALNLLYSTAPQTLQAFWETGASWEATASWEPATTGVANIPSLVWRDSLNAQVGASTQVFDDAVVYCNGAENVIWGGKESHIAGFHVFDGVNNPATFYYDYTSRVETKQGELAGATADQYANLNNTGSNAPLWAYIGFTRPITGFNVYLRTANTMAGQSKVEYWNGSTWNILMVSDGTLYTNGTISLSQTGSISFQDTQNLAKPLLIRNTLLYWYRWSIPSVSPNTSLYYLSASYNAQKLNDLWDGAQRNIVSCLYSASGIYVDNTVNVSKIDYTTGLASTYLDISSMQSGSGAVYFGFAEPMCAMNLLIPSPSTSGGAMTVSYWNGLSWTPVQGLQDGTAIGGISQINVTAGGAGYNHVPTISLSLGTGGAGNVTSMGVSSVYMNQGGVGYTSMPTASPTASPTGDSATFTVAGGIIVTANAPGSGYTSAPVITITPNGGGSGAVAQALMSVIVGTSSWTQVAGGNYSTAPTVSFIGGGGNPQATGQAIMGINTGTASTTITNNGSGYTGVATPTFGAGGATGTCNMGAVFAIGSGGSLYTGVASVNISGGSPTTPATANAVMAVGSVSVAAPVLNTQGQGYAANATVSLIGGGGIGATASCSMGIVYVGINSGWSYPSPPTNFNSAFQANGASCTIATNQVGSVYVITSVTVTSAGSGFVWPYSGSLGSIGTFNVNPSAGVSGNETNLLLGIVSVSVQSTGTGYIGQPTAQFTTPAVGSAPSATCYLKVVGLTQTPGIGYTSVPSVSISGNATITASLNVQSITVATAGSYINAMPTVSISAPPSGVTATATVNFAQVVGINMLTGGANYTSAPAPVFSPSGAVFTIASMGITGVNMISSGLGYTALPTSIVASGGGGSGATFTSSIGNLVLTISHAGSGYVQVPAITISGGSPTTPAIATAYMNILAVGGITGGSGYSQAPAVSFSPAPTGPGAAQATATANISGGAISTISMNQNGGGYASLPAVVIQASLGTTTNFSATATINAGTVTGITVNTPGGGFLYPPTIVITPTGGDTPSPAATAAAVLSLSATLGQSGQVSWTPSPLGAEQRTALVTNLGSVALYYYRLTANKTLSSNTFVDYVSAIPSPKPLNSYAFPLFAKNRIMLFNDVLGLNNEILVGAASSNVVFNGADSTFLYLGDARPITGAQSMFIRAGGSIFGDVVICKEDETWLLDGDNPGNFRIFKISGIYGCVARDTMKTCDLGYDQAGLSKNVIIWQSAQGLVQFDGTTVIPISEDIKDLFDPTSTTKITNPSKSTGFYDPFYREYHWLYCSASNVSGVPDSEIVYDVTRRKWFSINRTANETIRAGTGSIDSLGNSYTYGVSGNGDIYQLEIGPMFDQQPIAYRLKTGDMAIGGWEREAILRKVKVLAKAKNITPSLLTVNDYLNMSNTPTLVGTGTVKNTGAELATLKFSTSNRGMTHSLEVLLSTNNEKIGLEPWGLHCFYELAREDI